MYSHAEENDFKRIKRFVVVSKPAKILFLILYSHCIEKLSCQFNIIIKRGKKRKRKKKKKWIVDIVDVTYV